MASIGIIRNTKEVIDATPIVDGQILITIDKGDDNKVYMDYGSQRITIGNGKPIDSVLNAESDNPIANKAVAGVMLQTMEQIQAVTKSGFLADAKAIKELTEYVTKLSTSVEISWEDYQALSDEEKNSGVVYFIKDYQSGLYTAGREVTRAEYDALTKEQQNNGTLWLITDDSNGISALGVDYDNHKSGTKSATVQGALDEICGRLAQTTDSIQSQIVPTASIEMGETASKAYNVGDFLVKTGVLYKVTNAIVKDDALTVGTNIELDTVASELSSISERLSQMSQSEYKIKEYVFENTNVSQWIIYDIDESNAFLDGSSYLDGTNKIRYSLNYSSDNYCLINYKDGATKIHFWSNHAGTVHAFVRYK